MPFKFDATLKDIVADHPADFAAAFGAPPSEPAVSLNVDLSTVSAATDAAIGLGKPVREILDLNFQSGPDAGLPARLLLYNAALFIRYKAPVRSVAVLLRPKADGPNLKGKLTYGSAGHRVEFEYGVVRLWQEPVERFLQATPTLLPLSTLCEMPAGRSVRDSLHDVVRTIERRLFSETSHAEAVRLMTATYILTQLRVKKTSLGAIYKGVGFMEDVMSAYDEIQQEAAVKVLLRLGRKRFGEPEAETEATLRDLQDLDRLDRLVDAVLTAKSWNELLTTP